MKRPQDQWLIAQFGDNDVQAVAALFREYASNVNVDLCFQGFANELAGLPGDYAPPGGSLLIAFGAQGEPIGCIALKPLAGGAGELKRLYVRPHMRGLGLGGALVAAALGEATRIGYRELKLDTLPTMKGAIAVYQSFGFKTIEPYGSFPYPNLLCFGRQLP